MPKRSATTLNVTATRARAHKQFTGERARGGGAAAAWSASGARAHGRMFSCMYEGCEGTGTLKMRGGCTDGAGQAMPCKAAAAHDVSGRSW